MAHKAGIVRQVYPVTDRESRMVELAAKLSGMSCQAWVHDVVMREARIVTAGRWVEAVAEDPRQLKLFPAELGKGSCKGGK